MASRFGKIKMYWFIICICSALEMWSLSQPIGAQNYPKRRMDGFFRVLFENRDVGAAMQFIDPLAYRNRYMFADCLFYLKRDKITRGSNKRAIREFLSKITKKRGRLVLPGVEASDDFEEDIKLMYSESINKPKLEKYFVPSKRLTTNRFASGLFVKTEESRFYRRHYRVDRIFVSVITVASPENDQDYDELILFLWAKKNRS